MYNVSYTRTIKQNMHRAALSAPPPQPARRRRHVHSVSSPSSIYGGANAPGGRRQDPKLQALIDFSHLDKNDLFKIAQGKKHKKQKKKKKKKQKQGANGSSGTVRAAAKASAHRRASGNLHGDLEARAYELKFELESDKVYAIPIPSEVHTSSNRLKATTTVRKANQQGQLQRRRHGHGQLPKLGGRRVSGPDRRTLTTTTTTTKRGQLLPSSSSSRHARQHQHTKKKKKNMSGRQRRLQRIGAATDIQRIVRGRVGRQKANEVRQRRKYLRSLTQRAEVGRSAWLVVAWLAACVGAWLI